MGGRKKSLPATGSKKHEKISKLQYLLYSDDILLYVENPKTIRAYQ